MRLRSLFIFLAFTVWHAAAEQPEAPAHAQPLQSQHPPQGEYILGPYDELTIWVRDSDEFSGKTFRLDAQGRVSLPFVNQMTASGMTVLAFETALKKALEPFFVQPHAIVTVAQYRSQPVSLFGAVARPGTLHLAGRTTLIELISMAGGLAADAGHTLKLTRAKHYGPLPVEGGVDDSSGTHTTVELRIDEIMDGKNLAANIVVHGHDVVNVAKAEIVYVMGDVNRAGGFVMRGSERLTVIRAIAMAEGARETAAMSRALIMRTVPDGPRQGIPIDLKKILAGKAEDHHLRPGDILYVPDSKTKKAAMRAAQISIGVASGVALWRLGNR